VNSQPGWLYEGNAVLHPRGAECQTKLVVDGIPLIDNRSPGFGQEAGRSRYVDFGGLFFGNALGPSRQYTFRLVTTF
jgi:hypothetical protein